MAVSNEVSVDVRPDRLDFEIPGEAYTHAGMFHADDVLSTALLRNLRPDMVVHRVLSVPDGVVSVPQAGANAIVYDIGGGDFDHHQSDCPSRDDGTKYASLGRIWQAVWPAFTDDAETARRFDEKVIRALDETDNFGGSNVVCQWVSNFNVPFGSSAEEVDEAFAKAVDCVGSLFDDALFYVMGDYDLNPSEDSFSAHDIVVEALSRMAGVEFSSDTSVSDVWSELSSSYFSTNKFSRGFEFGFLSPMATGDEFANGEGARFLIEDLNAYGDGDVDCQRERAVSIVQTFIENNASVMAESEADYLRTCSLVASAKGPIIDFGDDLPRWKAAVCERYDIAYVTYASNRGGFNVQAVPVSPNSGESRVPLPESIRGRSRDEIREISGIDGVNFVHASGFLAACDTEDVARSLAEWSLAEEYARLMRLADADTLSAEDCERLESGMFDGVREYVTGHDEVESCDEDVTSAVRSVSDIVRSMHTRDRDDFDAGDSLS